MPGKIIKASVVKRRPRFMLKRNPDGSANVTLKDGKTRHFTSVEFADLEFAAIRILYSYSEWAVWFLKKFLFWTQWPVKIISSSGQTIFSSDYGSAKVLGIDKNSPFAISLMIVFLIGGGYMNATTRWQAMRRRKMFGTSTFDDVLTDLVEDEMTVTEVEGQASEGRRHLVSGSLPSYSGDEVAKLKNVVFTGHKKAIYYTISVWSVIAALGTSSMACMVTMLNTGSLGRRLQESAGEDRIPNGFVMAISFMAGLSSFTSRLAFYGLPLITNLRKWARGVLVHGFRTRAYAVSDRRRYWIKTKIGVGVACLLAGHFFSGKSAFLNMFHLTHSDLSDAEIESQFQAAAIALTVGSLLPSTTEILFTRVRALNEQIYVEKEEPNPDFFHEQEMALVHMPWWAYAPWLFGGIDLLQTVYFGALGNVSTWHDLTGFCLEPILEYFEEISPCLIMLCVSFVFSIFAGEMYARFATMPYCSDQSEALRNMVWGVKDETVFLEENGDRLDIVAAPSDSGSGIASCLGSLFSSRSPDRARRVVIDDNKDSELQEFARLAPAE